MKKILVAVDGTKSSRKIIKTVAELYGYCQPESITLLYVQRMEGPSILDDLLLSESETSTLKQSLQGTEHQEKLDQEARQILSSLENLLKENEISGVKLMIKEGHPAEEILKAAEEIEADLIVMGCRGKRQQNIFLGSVSREVSNNSNQSIMIVK